MDVILDRLEAEGRWPKFIYVVPNFSNPGGMTLPLDRRERLVETARERDLLIVEDNPYGLLRFEEEPLPTMYSLDTEENVVYLLSLIHISEPTRLRRISYAVFCLKKKKKKTQKSKNIW